MSRLEERQTAPRIYDASIDRTHSTEAEVKTPITERLIALVKSAADFILWPKATPVTKDLFDQNFRWDWSKF